MSWSCLPSTETLDRAQKVDDIVDALLKVGIFGTVLAGRSLSWLRGASLTDTFWQRIETLSFVRFGVISIPWIMDLGKVVNGEFIKKEDSVTKKVELIGCATTDLTTAMLFLQELGVLHWGRCEWPIDRICYISWVVNTTAAMKTSYDTGTKTAITSAIASWGFSVASLFCIKHSHSMATTGFLAGATGFYKLMR